MTDFNPISAMFRFNDRANALVLDAAQTLDDSRLDQRFEMGMGTLRRTLQHIAIGESVWLERWRGHIETPWRGEDEPVPVSMIAARLSSIWRERDTFLSCLAPGDMARLRTYRDSKGSLFRAALGDMILQMCMHSTHHRAQAVNMLRHLGVNPPPQVDYMMLARQTL